MTAPENDGGPAFPIQGYSGMSLRDWFAGQALAAVQSPDLRGEASFTAEAVYAIADAMLAARGRP